MTDDYDGFDFKLLRFNPIRADRGVGAAQLRVSDGINQDDVLWMTQRDIDLNIKEIGPHPELLKAKEAYRTREWFPPQDIPPRRKQMPKIS